MKITNKYGVPEPLMTLARGEYYSKGDSEYSVTELMSPPRIRRLREQHQDNVEQDVSDMLWSIFGSAVHVVMERGDTPGWVKEERIYHTIDGVKISGQIDLQQETPDGLIVMDYKVTSAWAVMQDKVEWEQQLNLYKWLIEVTKSRKVCGLKICAMIRDFSRHEKKEGYPSNPIHMIDIPMWTAVEAERFVRERLALHMNSKTPGAQLPPCTQDERWMSETIYAVMREGRKTAIRVFKDSSEAQSCAKEEQKKGKGNVTIDIRPAEPKRCTGDFCGVARFCDQYQAEIIPTIVDTPQG